MQKHGTEKMNTMFSVGNQARNNSVLMASVSIAKNTEMYNITDLISKADEVGCLLLFYLQQLNVCVYTRTNTTPGINL